MLLTRDAIQAAHDLKFEDVPVPEWNGTVRLRGMTGRERDAFENDSIIGQGKERQVNLNNIRARLVARCAVDDQGNLLFSEADALWLGEKNGAVLDRLSDVARRLSGLTKADVEELAKKSESVQSADSGSN